MGNGRLESTRVKLAYQAIKRLWIHPEVRDMEDSFHEWRRREMESSQTRVEASVGRANVGDSGACTDASAVLWSGSA